VLRNDVKVTPADLTNFSIQNAFITEQGVCTNISVTIQYIYHWLSGTGAVGINSLMEDAATAEISRG
jgi:malate synthase